jgi:transposase
MRAQRAKLSRSNDVAKAMDYMLKRWSAFTRFLDDGRIRRRTWAALRSAQAQAFGSEKLGDLVTLPCVYRKPHLS